MCVSGQGQRRKLGLGLFCSITEGCTEHCRGQRLLILIFKAGLCWGGFGAVELLAPWGRLLHGGDAASSGAGVGGFLKVVVKLGGAGKSR